MTLQPLLDAMAAHVADELARADRALAASQDADNSSAQRALLNDCHDHRSKARVWQQAHDLAAPHANHHHVPAPRDTPADTLHIPGRVRLGSPGDGEVGDDE